MIKLQQKVAFPLELKLSPVIKVQNIFTFFICIIFVWERIINLQETAEMMKSQ